MIAVQEVSKFLGKKELFAKVSFHIQAGERIGLIGTNGAGKTTLLEILRGEIEPDSGTVAKNRHTSIGYLPQQWSPIDERPVLAHAMAIDSRLNRLREELAGLQQRMETEPSPQRVQAMALQQAQLIEEQEHLAGYDLEARARKILAGLGFRDEQLTRPASTLSGGWAMRLALGRLLLAEPELLLLDEPTNHLDLDTLLWLEQYLINAQSAMIIISHDRAFLNRVVQRILELEQGALQEYPGNYDYYLQEKAQRREIQLASYRNQQDRIRQLERFIDRNRYRKSTARRAQSRLKNLEKIDRLEAPAEQAAMHFAFPDPPRSGKRVVELQQVHKAYGEVEVYGGIDMVVERRERLAFLGPNGAGKSTLLKILAGVEPITAGKRLVGHGAVLGYYAQYQWEQLHAEWTVLEETVSVAGDLPQTQIRSLLGAFLFSGDDVMKKVAVLSGGEKARLILCKLLLQRPNVLLLDEPTNHLDIPSRDVLEEALREFPGTICFISHDRHFIDAIANKVVVVDAGQIHFFPGNYSDYLTIWKKRLEASVADTAPEAAPDGETPTETGSARRGPEQKRLQAQWRNQLYRLKKPMEEGLQRVDAALETAHRELDMLNGQLADPATYQDGRTVQQVQIQYQQCQQQIKDLTAEWEAIALELEELEENFWKDKASGCGEGGPEPCVDGVS